MSGAGAASDCYETSDSQIDYRLLLSGLTKGFDFEVTQPSVVDFLLGFEQSEIDAQLVYVGYSNYNPEVIPFTLDSDDLTNHGEPEMSASGVYIWYDPPTAKWHIRYVIEGSAATFAYGGRISTEGFLNNVIPTGLDIETPLLINKLLKNEGNATFIDETFTAGFAQSFGNARSAIFSDFDNDGDLDLYVVYSGGMSNAPNRLFENNGNGRFYDVADISGAQADVEGRENPQLLPIIIMMDSWTFLF